MASPTQWTWVYVDSGSWWWTGRPGVLRFMGSQRVRHDWASELNYLPPEKSAWGQETEVRTGHGTTYWFQIRKEVHQGYILSPCLFNLHAKCIIWNANLDEAQAGIKISGRISITSNTRWPTLMAGNEEELKSLLMKVQEESGKVGLKLTFRKLRSWHPVPSLHGK